MESFNQVCYILGNLSKTDIKGVAIFVKTGFKRFQKFYFSVQAAKQRSCCAQLLEQWKRPNFGHKSFFLRELSDKAPHVLSPFCSHSRSPYAIEQNVFQYIPTPIEKYKL
jgi:hypothetical protein